MNCMKLFQLAFNLYILKKAPVSLIHFVTNRCNARCKHCFIDFDNPKLFENELTLEEIEKLSKSLDSRLFNINLTGGEPFLREDILKIVSLYFKNTPIESVFITTNGMLTNRIKNFVDKFIAKKIKGKLIFSISIDNFEKKHDANRRLKGLFKNAIKTYQILQDYNRPHIIANIGITVSHHNYKEVAALYQYLKNLGVKSITATIMREEGAIKKINWQTKKKILKAYKVLTKLIQQGQASGKMTGFGNHLQGRLMNAKNLIVNQIIERTYLKPKFISFCPAGSLFGVIQANGDVYPCEILNTPLGNLRDYEMNFEKLWQSEKAKNCRKFIKDSRCHCTFECAWTINVISHLKFLPSLLLKAVKTQK